MGNIKIIKGVFDTKLELEHAGVAAGFPILTDDYSHETLDFNRDYIKHPDASFYGDVEGDSMKDAGIFDGKIIRAWMMRHRQANYILIPWPFFLNIVVRALPESCCWLPRNGLIVWGYHVSDSW